MDISDWNGLAKFHIRLAQDMKQKTTEVNNLTKVLNAQEKLIVALKNKIGELGGNPEEVKLHE